ncbi:vitamin K epoxide reductase family protein [Chitinophaga sp. Hz27]|uniref:vitamin K epoxide reductase family protein n=1 Tax=Chitinophaga sp. Hz27 TaxID=3347169 RepID=UPI0035DA038F
MLRFFKNFPEPKSNGPETAKILVDALGVKISASTLRKEIEEHPDYPSLVSISDVLNNYHLDNLTGKFSPDKFIHIPTPFITQIKGKDPATAFFTVVTAIKNNKIHYFDPEKQKWRISSFDDFFLIYAGISLLAEPAEGAGEKEYAQKVREEKRQQITQYLLAFCLPAIVMLIGALSFLHHGMNALLPFLFSLLTLSGCIVGVLLLWYEVDQYNPVLKKICSAGKKVNCGAILNSEASKIAGISWSVIGFTYFMGGLLLLLFSGITNPTILSALAWVNTLATPYIIYSLYYQWRIAKQWCVLCLSVQGILLLQLITALIAGWHTPVEDLFTLRLLFPFVISYLIPFMMVSLLVPAYRAAKGNKRTINQLQRLKHNPRVFEALLTKQKKLTENPQGLGILLGNPNATHKIIKACNPYCGPCADAHTPMEALLHNNDDLQIQIIFTAYDNDIDITANPAKHLLAISEKGDEVYTKQALDDWYLSPAKDYEVFANKYPMSNDLHSQRSKVKAMRGWCDKAEITFTPTFFISLPSSGGHGETGYYQLPDSYSVSDLKYFLST